MADQICWLIERADPRNPGCVMPNSFLGVRGTYDGRMGAGQFEWMDSAHNALRFTRQVDAALVVGAVITLQDRMMLRDTLGGIRSCDPRPIVVEHMWTDDTVSA